MRVRYDDDCERLTTDEAKAWAISYLKGFYGRDNDPDYSWCLAVNPKKDLPVLLRFSEYLFLKESGEWEQGIMKRTYKAGKGSGYGMRASDAAAPSTRKIPIREVPSLHDRKLDQVQALLRNGLKEGLDTEGYEKLIKQALAISTRTS